MTIDREQYLQCPYCTRFNGGHGIRVPKNIGLYRVKQIYDNILILQCQKCRKVFRVAMRGSMLLWSDMDRQERQAFKKEKWNIYKDKGGQKQNETNNRQ